MTCSWRRLIVGLLTVSLASGEEQTLAQQKHRSKGSSLQDALQWHAQALAESSASPRRKTLHIRVFSSSSSRGKSGKGRSGSHAGYLGCLGLSSNDLQEKWIFQSQAASCSYTYHSSSGGKSGGKGGSRKWNWWSHGGSSGGGSGGGDDDDTSTSSGGGGSSGSSGSGGGGGGDDDNGGDGGSNNGNGGGGNNGNGGGGNNGGNGGNNNSNNNGGGGNNGGGNGGNNNNYNGGGGNNGGGNGGNNNNYNGGGGNNGGGNGGNNNGNGGGGNNGNGGGGNNGNGGGGGNKNGNGDNRNGEKDDYSPYDGQEISNEDFGNVDVSDDDYYYVYDDDGGTGSHSGNGGNGQVDDDQSGAGGGNGDQQNGGGGGADGGDDKVNQQNSGGGGGDSGDDKVDQQNVAGSNRYDPYGSFEITSCDTYKNLWLWDLSLTCESDVSFANCECTFAEELVEQGYMNCDTMARKCPPDCQICTTCAKIMGCGGIMGSGIAQSPLLFLFAAFGLVCCGATYYYARHRRSTSDLAAHLMMDDKDDDDVPVWLVPDMPPPPVDKEFGPLQEIKQPSVQPCNEPYVWLVPDGNSFGGHNGTWSKGQFSRDNAEVADHHYHHETLLADHAEICSHGSNLLRAPSMTSLYNDNEGQNTVSFPVTGGSGDDGEQANGVVAQPRHESLDDLPAAVSYDSNGDGPYIWLAPDAVQFQPSLDAALGACDDDDGSEKEDQTNSVWLAPVA